jgi:hypothetical protein
METKIAQELEAESREINHSGHPFQNIFQLGFTSDVDVHQMLLLTAITLDQTKIQGGELYAISEDIVGAFNSLNHQVLKKGADSLSTQSTSLSNTLPKCSTQFKQQRGS